MQFKDFLAESLSKEYYYRIKIAADCGDEQLTIIENCLDKYSVQKVEPMKRTPIQENPSEFVRLKGVKLISEVCSTHVTLKYPTNTRILEVWLAVNLGISSDRVLVMEADSPREQESNAAAERLAADEDRYADMDDALLVNEDELTVEMDSFYGEGHKEKFLQELARVKKEKGDDYFRNYPSKGELMGDNLRPMYDTLMNMPNMGMGDTTKEVSVNDQNLG